jgi:hypothetical protein
VAWLEGDECPGWRGQVSAQHDSSRATLGWDPASFASHNEHKCTLDGSDMTHCTPNSFWSGTVNLTDWLLVKINLVQFHTYQQGIELMIVRKLVQIDINTVLNWWLLVELIQTDTNKHRSELIIASKKLTGLKMRTCMYISTKLNLMLSHIKHINVEHMLCWLIDWLMKSLKNISTAAANRLNFHVNGRHFSRKLSGLHCKVMQACGWPLQLTGKWAPPHAE